MKRLTIAATLACYVAAALSTTARAEEDYVAVRAAIDSMNGIWCRAYAAHDIDGALSVATTNAVALGGDGVVSRTIAARKATLASVFQRYNPVDAHIVTERVWLLDGDAFEYGHYSITFVPQARDTVEFDREYVARWVKQADGTWKTSLMIGLPEDPPEPGR